MRSLLYFLIAWAVLSPVAAHTPGAVWDPEAAKKADPLFDLETYKRLNAVTINVDWKNADIQAVLDELSAKNKKADPANSGKFTLQIPANFDLKRYHREVAMTLTSVPIFEVLQYVSQQTNLNPLIHKDEVIMVPGIETRLTLQPADPRWEK